MKGVGILKGVRIWKGVRILKVRDRKVSLEICNGLRRRHDDRGGSFGGQI